MKFPLSFPILSLAVLALCVGCGGSGENLSNVTGTITMDGEPLANALVQFTPVEGSRMAAGRTDEDGRYELIFGRNAEGALPGEYVVRVSTYLELPKEDSDTDEAIITPESVPVTYNIQSDLKATVTDGGDNTFDFDLKSDAGEVVQPDNY